MTPPDTRQRIVVLSRDDYNRARIMSPELLVDPLTRVVALPLRPPDSEDETLLALSHELRPSAVLLRNTLGGDTYVDAAAAYEVISLAKFNHFANVCQMLGATRLEVKELRELSDDGKVEASVGFRASAAEGTGTLRKEASRRLAQSIQGLWVWQSAAGDADRAAAYVRAERVSGDPVISGLIQQRRFTGNPLEEHVLELNISSEAQRVVQGTQEIKTALRRLGPAFDSTFESLRRHGQQLVLRIRVVFAPSGM
jgi:hypothetical protein